MMMRVLSIDGGGIRGVIPATVLTELERLSGQRIADLFDVIVGTSTGGILALALTCPRAGHGPRPAAEIGNLYIERGSQIFPLGGVPIVDPGHLVPPGVNEQPTLLGKLKRLSGWDGIGKTFSWGGGHGAQGNARYPAAPLEAELEDQLGETLMSEAIKPVAVVSCDLQRSAPLVLKGGGLDQGAVGNFRMKDAARATSAGPTFFPLKELRDAGGITHMCADGGLVANDPAFVGYTEAMAVLRARNANADDLLVVSIGTGQANPARPPEEDDVPQLTPTKTWLNFLGPVMKTMSSAGGELQRQQLAQILGSNYIRLQPTLAFGAVHAMDNVTPSNINALQATAQQFVLDEATTLGQLVSTLTK